MKVLTVFSGNTYEEIFDFKKHKSFVYEQIESLRIYGVDYETFPIIGYGVKGYLRNYKPLKNKLKEGNYDLIHAHYGLSGLLSVLQKQIPVIITFHGSDVFSLKTRFLSLIASRLSSKNIFVHPSMPKKLFISPKDAHIIPCGVNIEQFYPIKKDVAREKLGLIKNKKYALFSSRYDNPVKNYPLARNALAKCKYDISLIELKGYNREDVNLLLNAVDFLLITSHREAGPVIAKEAMACNLPIVATDVGDIRQLTKTESGHFIASSDAQSIAIEIENALEFGKETNARQVIMAYSTNEIAKKIFSLYKNIG